MEEEKNINIQVDVLRPPQRNSAGNFSPQWMPVWGMRQNDIKNDKPTILEAIRAAIATEKLKPEFDGFSKKDVVAVTVWDDDFRSIEIYDGFFLL